MQVCKQRKNKDKRPALPSVFLAHYRPLTRQDVLPAVGGEFCPFKGLCIFRHELMAAVEGEGLVGEGSLCLTLFCVNAEILSM